MYITDDPIADFERYDLEQTKLEAKLPHCDYCGAALYESYYYINGETLCEECLIDNFMREVEFD